MKKNILFLSLSVVSPNYKDNEFYYYINTSENKELRFVSDIAQGAITMYLMNKLAEKNEKIDQIYVLCTSKVLGDPERSDDPSISFNIYKSCIKDYLQGKAIDNLDEIKKYFDEETIKIMDKHIEDVVNNTIKEKLSKLNDIQQLKMDLDNISRMIMKDITEKITTGKYRNIQIQKIDESKKVYLNIRPNSIHEIFPNRIEQLFRKYVKKYMKARNAYISLNNRTSETIDKLITDNQKALDYNKIKIYVKMRLYRIYCDLVADKTDDHNDLVSLYGKEMPEIIPIHLGESKSDIGIKNILSTLNNLNEEDDIYIDTKGGLRIYNSILNTSMNLMKIREIRPKEVCDLEFDPQKIFTRITDETLTYRIYDLISAMDEFKYSGTSKSLKKYYGAYKNYKYKDKKDDIVLPEDFIVDAIEKISNAVSLCDLLNFEDGIVELNKALRSYNKTKDEKDPLFENFTTDIEKPYQNLQNNILAEIKFCIEHKLYQQALTFIEEKLPDYYYEHGLLSFEIKFFNDNQTIDYDTIKEWKNHDDYYTKINRLKGKINNEYRKECIRLGEKDFNSIFKLKNGRLSNSLLYFGHRYFTDRDRIKNNRDDKNRKNIFDCLNNDEDITFDTSLIEVGGSFCIKFTYNKMNELDILRNILKKHLDLKIQRNFVNHASEDENQDRWELSKIIKTINELCEDLESITKTEESTSGQ